METRFDPSSAPAFTWQRTTVTIWLFLALSRSRKSAADAPMWTDTDRAPLRAIDHGTARVRRGGRQNPGDLRLLPPPDNLPHLLTSFVGRGRDLEALRDLAGYRLVTLTGPGGIGKTRLAVRAAEARVIEYPHGVWFVGLAGVNGAEEVASAVAATLPIARIRGSDDESSLVAYLAPRTVLLLLDNCEHVAEPCARLAARLLAACPGLSVVATSRRPLGVAGERTYEVHPLGISSSIGTSDDVAGFPAAVLLVDRIRAVRPDYSPGPEDVPLIHRLCRELGGMPLAIELAAARIRYMTLGEILERLRSDQQLLSGGPRDAHPRQQSLQSTLEWSYRLLDPGAAALFPRFAVFRGGFDLEAAITVSGDAGRDDVLATLGRLVADSLVEAGEGVRGRSRYRLLEPIRTYASGLLGPASDEASSLHAGHYADLAVRAESGLYTADEAVWLDRLDADHENLRAALSRLTETAPERALDMAAALWRFWFIRGYSFEGRAWLDRALSASSGQGSIRIRALIGRSFLEQRVATDLPRAREFALEAYEDAVQAEDKSLAARALLALGSLALPDRPSAIGSLTSALEIVQSLGEQPLEAEIRGHLATVTFMHGRRGEATEEARRALALARSLGTPTLILEPAKVLARDAFFERSPEAGQLWAECLAGGRELGHRDDIRFCLNFLGALAADRGDVGEAASRIAEASRIAQVVGSRQDLVQMLDFAALLSIAAGNAGRAIALVACKESVQGPDWVESPFWTAYMAARTKAASARVGPAAARRHHEGGRRLSLEQGIALAARSIEEATAVAKRRLRGSRATEALTNRETEIAHLIARGLTNREIASRLVVSERTAESHVEHILNKLGAANRAQIAAWATQAEVNAHPAPRV